MKPIEAGIRDILAHNIRENRRRCGFSQEKLAEKAGISKPFLAMIEVCRKFPTPDVLDRIACALGVRTHELFAVPPSPAEEMERLRQDIVRDIDRVVSEAVERAIGRKLLR
jgi:transcriptional regulator with XRE-family HTH domain